MNGMMLAVAAMIGSQRGNGLSKRALIWLLALLVVCLLAAVVTYPAFGAEPESDRRQIQDYSGQNFAIWDWFPDEYMEFDPKPDITVIELSKITMILFSMRGDIFINTKRLWQMLEQAGPEVIRHFRKI